MKIVKWLGVGVGIILVLAILAAGVMNLVFGHQLRQTLAKHKAEGRPLTVAEIRPAPVPEDQNTAPLFQKAASLLTNAPVSPAIQELTDLIATNKSTIDIRAWPDAQRDALPRLIQAPELQALFAVLSDAAQKPGNNGNLRYEDGPAMLLPNLGSIRHMARFLGLKAEVAAQNGNGEEAGATVLEGLKLANLLKQEPTLIHALVFIACDGILIDCLERILDRVDIPAGTSQSLMAELDRHIDPAPFVRCMDGERICMGMWVYRQFQGDTDIVMNIGPMSDRTRLMIIFVRIAAWLYRMTGLLTRDMNVYLTLLARVQDEFKMPYHQIAATIRQHPIENQIPACCPLTRMLLPSLDAVVTKKAAHEATLQVARVGLGLKQFKQKNRVYPDTLAQLSPEFLDHVPVDPCTGKALVYRKDGDGFVLYSLGPNQQDDAGTPKPSTAKRDDKTPDDIVWKAAR